MTEPRRSLDDLSGLTLDKGAPRARRPRWKRRVIIAAVLLVPLVVVGAVLVRHMTTPELKTARVTRIAPNADLEITTANGHVIPRRRASVASKTQGRLAKVFVDEGDLVAEDKVLAEVEHHEEDAAVAEARANLQSATDSEQSYVAAQGEADAALATARAALDEKKAAVSQAKAVQTERHAAYARAQELVRTQIANDAQLETAKMQMDVADALLAQADTALVTATQSVRQSEAAVLTARARLEAQRSVTRGSAASLTRNEATRENAFIKAPFAGMVLRREAEPGEVVSPANTGASGSKTAVVTMADLATQEVEVDVYERDIARIGGDTECRIVLDAYADQLLAGKVRLVRPTADRSKATIKVNVGFAQVPELARPEMGARVTFFQKGADPKAPDRIEVDPKAIVTRDGKQGVLVLEGGKQTFTVVELGEVKDGRQLIKKGLNGGETVVLP